MKEYIKYIESKNKSTVQDKPAQQKKFVRQNSQPVNESKEQKVQAFINVIGEILYKHGLNETKINEIVNEIYKKPNTNESFSKPQSVVHGNYNPIAINNTRNTRKNIPDPIDYANNLLLDDNEQYTQRPYEPIQYQQPQQYQQYQQPQPSFQNNMPLPQMGNSKQHNEIYNQMNELGSQYGNVYAPTIESNFSNPTGQITMLPMPKEFGSYIQVAQQAPQQVPQRQISSNTQMDYGSELL